MRKISIMFVLILSAIMAFGSIGTAFAQGDAVTNFVFTSDATLLSTPYFATLGGNVRLSDIPSQDNNTALMTMPSGTLVQVLGEYDQSEWLLVRAWNATNYIGYGWMNTDASRMTRLTANPAARNWVPDCTVTDRGEQMFVHTRWNAGWRADALNTECALFFEGRIEETDVHHYWIIRDNNGSGRPVTQMTSAYLQNGTMYLLEGTSWIHPTTWNVGRGFRPNFTTLTLRYPAMIAYFARDKQQVMRENDYGWPFQIHMLNGTTVDFAYGAFGTDANDVDRCNLTTPRVQNVTGIFVTDEGYFRSTSVGAIGCRSLFLWQLPDGTWQILLFTNARERLEYTAIVTAVLLPSSWTQTQINSYVVGTVLRNADLPDGTEIDNEGLTGMPATITIEQCR